MPKIIINTKDLDELPDYLKEFYKEGREAKKAGIRLWDCSHKGILPLERAWQAGWTDEEWNIVHTESELPSIDWFQRGKHDRKRKSGKDFSPVLNDRWNGIFV